MDEWARWVMVKRSILGLVESVRLQDAEAGSYLDRHVIFDDEERTVRFTGDPGMFEFGEG